MSARRARLGGLTLAATGSVLFPLKAIGVARVGSSAAGQTGMLRPAATIGFAALLLDEPVSATQLLGTAIGLIGVFVLTMKKD